MARAKTRKPSYEPAPKIPEEIEERYQVILEVLSGRRSVASGARRLGLSRNHFQTLMHRGLKGLLEALEPRPTGRPPKPGRVRELEEEVEQLQRENERLSRRVGTIDRLLGAASDLLHGRAVTSGRTKGRKSKKRKDAEESDDDGPKALLVAARALRRKGLTVILVAVLVGVSASTLGRWARREQRGERIVWRRGPGPRDPVDDHTAALVEDRVRASNGLIGADALRHGVGGVSRRQAATVKRDALVQMERERKAGTPRIEVTTPGVVRGFDAMHILTTGGWRFLLASGDGSIPFRTSIGVAARYDGDSVAALLERDIRVHGAPLVYRMDRAKAHSVREVQELLEAEGVLVLHGPPRHPRYYGQLERQNREHRAWLDVLGVLDPDALEAACPRMRSALNGDWCRPTLGWRTAQEAWDARPRLDVDRVALGEEVQERAARIQRHLDERGVRGRPADLAVRLAIEQALTQRGFLRREIGGWC